MRLHNNRVVWSEGLFLRPQHFQQNERFIEHLIDSRAGVLHPFPWGFSTLIVDSEALKLGKIALNACAGVFPDGTCFSIPDGGDPPAAISIDDGVSNEVIALAVPMCRVGAVQTTQPNAVNPLARYVERELAIHNTSDEHSQTAEIQVSEPQLRLLHSHDNHSNFVTMPVCRIHEADANRGIRLDTEFIPPTLNIGASPRLMNFLAEILGFMGERGSLLAGTIGAAETGGVSQVNDFLFLQLINRHICGIRHLSTVHESHPELLYRTLISLAGELATFSRSDRLVEQFPNYQHDNLTATFDPVITEIRSAFAASPTTRVISLPVETKSHGVRVIRIDDRTLLDSASFILAVNADVDPLQLQTEFTQHIKISPVEQIGKLVQGGYSGINARLLPSAPRSIPYHDGFTYFELERKGQYWEDLVNSAALSIHVPNRYPKLKLEMWAIRNLRGG